MSGAWKGLKELSDTLGLQLDHCIVMSPACQARLQLKLTARLNRQELGRPATVKRPVAPTPSPQYVCFLHLTDSGRTYDLLDDD